MSLPPSPDFEAAAQTATDAAPDAKYWRAHPYELLEKIASLRYGETDGATFVARLLKEIGEYRETTAQTGSLFLNFPPTAALQRLKPETPQRINWATVRFLCCYLDFAIENGRLEETRQIQCRALIKILAERKSYGRVSTSSSPRNIPSPRLRRKKNADGSRVQDRRHPQPLEKGPPQPNQGLPSEFSDDSIGALILRVHKASAEGIYTEAAREKLHASLIAFMQTSAESNTPAVNQETIKEWLFSPVKQTEAPDLSCWAFMYDYLAFARQRGEIPPKCLRTCEFVIREIEENLAAGQTSPRAEVILPIFAHPSTAVDQRVADEIGFLFAEEGCEVTSGPMPRSVRERLVAALRAARTATAAKP